MRKSLWVYLMLMLAWGVQALPEAPDAGELPKLDELLLRGDLWAMSKDEFVQNAAKYRFFWGSTAKDSARSTSPGTFRDETILEAIVRFGSNSVSEVRLSFYNRGDAGDITADAFESRVVSIEGRIRGFAGKPATEISPKEANNSERKFRTVIWMTAASVFRLEYAYTRARSQDTGRRMVRPEFINLTMLRNDKRMVRDFVSDIKADAGGMALKKRVKKNGNGDVVMESVPMVDQGQKGYCAVAAAERVLRYYGTDVNQHELAQRASTASSGGTDPVSLVKALKAMSYPMGLKIKVLMQEQVSDLTRLVDGYNRAARKQKLRPVPLVTDGVINVAEIKEAMDKELFLKIKGKNPAGVEKFMRLVKDDVNEGHPILWGVNLGIVDETPAIPQARGGHIRLIIGYNLKTDEILYSDSWGAGHELKRMKAPNAFAVSSSLVVIEPK